ncbi:hypothetical protein Hamer_G024142 [Homarus americanus]|uniref:HAT C-terminal dimerisation domain-containing protein n=1 Tax=Homarus americanus TaxID=6706 RepID=A0A8J5JLT7_HOMAM|nr:hypothetical protein Hamer_G024142 [Homarus americanus]
MVRLPAILHVLHEIDLENSGDRSVEARGFLTQIDLTFFGLLATFPKLLGDTKLLSDMLQSPSPDIAKAVDLIEALQDTIQEYRNESFVEELWKGIVDTAKHCNGAVENAEKRLQKVNCRLGGSIVTSTIGQRRCNVGDKQLQEEDILPHRGHHCVIALAIPVSSAAGERSFLALQLIKSLLRTTKADSRLSNLGVLTIEARRDRSLGMDEFIKMFSIQHKNRRTQRF